MRPSLAPSADLDELFDFMKRPQGQDLLREVWACLQDVQKTARFCRARGRVSSGIRVAAGAAIAGASAAVMGTGLVVGTSGAAAPLVLAGACGVGSVAAAVGLGAQMINALVQLGWDQADASAVARRLETLKESLLKWDLYLGQVLDSAVDSEELFARLSGFVSLDILTTSGGANAVVYAPARGLSATLGFGTRAASRGLYAVSGVGLVCGLMDVVAGISRARRGKSEGADVLDAYADQICAVLHVMLGFATGTEAHAAIQHKVPVLVLVEVNRFVLPAPRYRPGDFAKRHLLGHKEVDVYFMARLAEGRTRRLEPSIAVTPGTEFRVPIRVLTRVFEHDCSLAIRAFSERSMATKAVFGDPSMGPAHMVDFTKVRLPFENYISTGSSGSLLQFSCRRPA